MKIINIILIALIALLSIAAGLAKAMQVPQEVEFLQSFGFTTTLVVAYGVIQILGGILLALAKSRKWGAIITFACFSVSTALIFIGGQLVFGMVSLLPIVMTGFIYLYCNRLTMTPSHSA